MKELSAAEIGWLELAAFGPFSYRAGARDTRTHVAGATFQTTTYQAMMRHGWVLEVV